jgi:hypothetical protein
MRTFSSYGPVNTKIHYYAPRKELINFGFNQLVGNNPEEGGHYITVWAPRQTGKSWTMQNILWRLQKDNKFDVLKINLEIFKMENNIQPVLQYIGKNIEKGLGKKITKTDNTEKFESLFTKESLKKPLILILDEFDALPENAISAIVGVFRNIYNIRHDQFFKTTDKKDYLLHSVALIGVRSVLGVENTKGSPFNVQRSLHIPNLTFDEVEDMFRWHEEESSQKIDQEVIDRLFYETRGQPGLTCWFGELLTEGCHFFTVEKNKHIDMNFFKRVYNTAISALPNNNIINIISKAKEEPYNDIVLDMFKTDAKLSFKYDDKNHSYLYMNGVIDTEETTEGAYYIKFPCPFVQKRLFNYFSSEIFEYVGKLYDPLEDMDDAITEHCLNIKNIMKRYRIYLIKNKNWVLKNAPRRSDMRIYEAVFHFNLYKYLSDFLESFKGEIYPEFPTGNGKIDLIVKYAGNIYGIELKTFKNKPAYNEALSQAAIYGKQLGLKEITLIFFIEIIDDENRKKYEADFFDDETGVKVMPLFVETGA